MMHQASSTTGFDWNYQHPEDWKKSKGFVKDGKRQSPINIVASQASKCASLVPLKLNTVWNESITGKNANTGRSVQFTPTDACVSMENHLGMYELQQFHVHWGSSRQDGTEHQIDGKQCAAEFHFVLKKTSGDAADGDHLSVLAVLCVEDRRVPITPGSVWEKIMPPVEYRAHTSIAGLVLSDLLPDDLSYFHYEGSLTTPPCSEVVQWFVLQKSIPVPLAYLQALRQVKDEEGHTLQCNCRDIQPLNRRHVQSS